MFFDIVGREMAVRQSRMLTQRPPEGRGGVTGSCESLSAKLSCKSVPSRRARDRY